MIRLLLIFLLSTSSLAAQVVVSHCSVTQTTNGANIDFTIAPGNTCEDLEVQYSTDSINFETVYVYQGVCGSTNSSQSYQYFHATTVCGTKVYYRLRTLTQGILANRSLFLVCYNANGYLVTSVPNSGKLQVTVDQQRSNVWILTLYDLSGKRAAVFTIRDVETTIHAEGLRGGIYLYRLEDEAGETFAGKVLL